MTTLSERDVATVTRVSVARQEPVYLGACRDDARSREARFGRRSPSRAEKQEGFLLPTPRSPPEAVGQKTPQTAGSEGTASISRRVYALAGARSTCAVEPCSRTSPPCNTTTSSQTFWITPRSCEMKR